MIWMIKDSEAWKFECLKSSNIQMLTNNRTTYPQPACNTTRWKWNLNGKLFPRLVCQKRWPSATRDEAQHMVSGGKLFKRIAPKQHQRRHCGGGREDNKVEQIFGSSRGKTATVVSRGCGWWWCCARGKRRKTAPRVFNYLKLPVGWWGGVEGLCNFILGQRISRSMWGKLRGGIYSS